MNSISLVNIRCTGTNSSPYRKNENYAVVLKQTTLTVSYDGKCTYQYDAGAGTGY